MSRSEPAKKGPSEPAGARQDELCQDSPVAHTTRQTALSPSSTGFRPECLAGNGHGTASPPWTVTDGFPLPPVRPHVGADGPALRAHHARTERGHRHVTREMVDVHDHFVSALATLHGERPHAVLAHVGEGSLKRLVAIAGN